jgi:membrane dipeptidase
LHNAYSANLSLKEATGARSFGRVAYVEGLENPTEGSKTIMRWLVKHGYSDEDIAKAMGGNALRVMTAAWG